MSVETLLGLNAGKADMRDLYRAGELKREFGVTHCTLRDYERKGFVSPVRQGIRRLYSRFDRRRLRLAILSQTFGFTMLEAAQIIDVYGGIRNIGTTVGVSE
ncbi:MerR family transcriptional regulator [Aureimonas leprariae]|uniref:MerR family transcriptional regulator n=1 Tax=Plantimonas leprariae TaxID=2615207 RepID=UPI001386BD16|nr:MerR family transcriptional regulator [Aureimonas leprariae]